MKYLIDHKTVYKYVAPVVQSHHILHLSPRQVEHQKIHGHSLVIEPSPASREDFMDYNQNPSSVVIIEEQHAHLQFHSHSEIEIIKNNLKKPENSKAWEEIAVEADNSNDLDVLEYSCFSPNTQINKAIYDYAKISFSDGCPVHEAAYDLMSRIFTEFTFDNSATDVSTPITKVLEIKRGVCQDFAHLQIACVRAMGIPARYVSGYILTKPPEGQKKLAGSDASHAWVSIWCGNEIGWVDYDPTNNMIASDEHITFAYGMDYDDISPISGVLIGGGEHTVSVAVDVISID